MRSARRATLRLLVNGFSVGLLIAMSLPGGGRADAAATGGDSGAGCAHDRALESSVARALRKKVREIEPASGARVEITFGCPTLPELEGVTALQAHGHGGFVSLIDVQGRSRGGAEVLRVRLQPASTPKLGDPAPAIARATAHPRDEVVDRALAFANAALASTILIHPPANAHGTSTVTTTHDEVLELHLLGPNGQSSTRRWDGYVDSVHAGARVPLEVAWEALWAISDRPLRPAPPEDGDRAAFQRLIDGEPRSRLATDALQALAASLAIRPHE